MKMNLLAILQQCEDLDAIVVEGYDGVGKGKVLNDLSEFYGVTPYRPDYNLWQNFDHRKSDRWKISGFFLDVYSHFNTHESPSLYKPPMLFDRGVISGAVYNNDFSIAEHYKEMLRDMKVVHILVSCSDKDYIKFLKSRNPEIPQEEIDLEVEKHNEYYIRYLNAFSISDVDFLLYMNEYDGDISTEVCSSCGHYSYGICRHPKINKEVDGSGKRCELSADLETQDILNVLSEVK